MPTKKHLEDYNGLHFCHQSPVTWRAVRCFNQTLELKVGTCTSCLCPSEYYSRLNNLPCGKVCGRLRWHSNKHFTSFETLRAGGHLCLSQVKETFGKGKEQAFIQADIQSYIYTEGEAVSSLQKERLGCAETSAVGYLGDFYRILQHRILQPRAGLVKSKAPRLWGQTPKFEFPHSRQTVTQHLCALVSLSVNGDHNCICLTRLL